MNDTNLPQEADRDEQSISFTKGCYLGQETVARLDALGQVQRKLVRWQLAIEGSKDDAAGDFAIETPQVGLTLEVDGKPVARITSVSTAAKDESGNTVYQAIGFARRSHFASGSVARGERVVGTVV